MVETVTDFEAERADRRLDDCARLKEQLRRSEDRVGELTNTVERLEREIEDLFAIGEVPRAVSAVPSIEEVLAGILNRMRRSLRTDRVMLGLVNLEGGYEEVKVALGVPAVDLRGSRWPIGESDPIWKRLLADPHSPATVRGDEPGLPDFVRVAFPEGFLRSPLMVGGELVGTIMVSTGDIGASPRDLRRLSILVGYAALAVENGRLNYNVIKSEERLVRTREQLLEAKSLAAVGQLAVGISHEINNPLCTINMSAQLLRLDLEEKAPDLVNRLEGIEQAVQRILAVTRKISAMSKLRSTEYLPNQMMVDLK
jgi:GAF domain-containing protein